MHGDQDSMDIEVIEDTAKAEIEANDVSKNLVRTKQLTWYFGKTKLLRTKLKMINKTTTNFLHYRRHQNNQKRTRLQQNFPQDTVKKNQKRIQAPGQTSTRKALMCTVQRPL